MFGYSDSDLDRFVYEKISTGNILPSASEIELQAALEINGVFPQYHLRFLKTGGAANLSAIRLARALTNRNVAIICSYHGWQDYFLPHRAGVEGYGIPASVANECVNVKFGDIDSLEKTIDKYKNNIAAVITTPWEKDKSDKKWLEKVAKIVKSNRAMLIVDEVSTSFKFHFGTFSQAWGIEADFITLGKTLGNGYSFSMLLGKPEHMDILRVGKVWISESSATETAGLAAAIRVLQRLRTGEYYEKTSFLGELFRKELELFSRERGFPIHIQGCGAQVVEINFMHSSNKEITKKFCTYLLSSGIYPGRFSHVIESMSKENILYCCEAIKQFCGTVLVDYLYR